MGKIKRVELSYRSFEEINAIREAIESDPANRAPKGNTYIYTSQARKRLDDIAWAVTNKMARERAAIAKVDKEK